MKNIADYKYNCIDKSILLPYFKKYYVSIFFKVVPFWLTANFITLISTFFIFALLVIVLLSENLTTVSNTLAIIFCLHTYIVGDHLDGMQAKHTKTSSPLGEFLDHYLDVFNGATAFGLIIQMFMYRNHLNRVVIPNGDPPSMTALPGFILVGILTSWCIGQMFVILKFLKVDG